MNRDKVYGSLVPAGRQWLALVLVGILSALVLYVFHHTRQDLIEIFRRENLFTVVPVIIGLLALGYFLVLSKFKSSAGLVLPIIFFAAVLISGKIAAIVMVALFSLACFALGLAMLGLITGDVPDLDMYSVSLSFLLGLGLNAYAIWLAMHYKINYAFSYMALLSVELALLKDRWREIWGGIAAWSKHPELSGGQKAILAWIVLFVPYVLVKSYFWDDIGVHLYIPKYVSLFHQFHYSPHFMFSFDHAIIPKSAYTLLFMIGDEFAVRLFNYLLFFLSIWIMEKYVRDEYTESVSFLTAAIILTTPFIIWQFAEVFIDSFALFSGTTLLIYFLKQKEINARRTLLFSIVCAFAYLSKQMTVFIIAPILLLFIIKIIRSSWRNKKIAQLLNILFGLIVFVAVLSPVFISAYKNVGSKGVYYLDALFQKKEPNKVNEMVDARWKKRASFNTLADITFHGKKYVEIGDHAFGFYYFIFGLFIPLLFIEKFRRRQHLVYVFVFTGACVLWFSMTGPYIRYFLNLLPLGSLLIAVVISRGLEMCRENKTLLNVYLVVLSAVFSYNILTQISCEGISRPYPLLAAITGKNTSTTNYWNDQKHVFDYAAAKFGKNAKGLLPGIYPYLYFADFNMEGSVYYRQYFNQALFNDAPAPAEIFKRIFITGRYNFIIEKVPSDIPAINQPEFQAMLVKDYESENNLYIPNQDVYIKQLEDYLASLEEYEEKPLFALDFPGLKRNGENGLQVNAVPADGLRINGWAVDPRNKNTATRVCLRVNGRLLEAQYGMDRKDVRRALKTRNYLGSGFACRVPAEYFHAGENKLEVIVVDHKGEKKYREEIPVLCPEQT
jgi:4-amino-4-deoxy-L-arabinose transferase-like glycosyltransferase